MLAPCRYYGDCRHFAEQVYYNSRPLNFAADVDCRGPGDWRGSRLPGVMLASPSSNTPRRTSAGGDQFYQPAATTKTATTGCRMQYSFSGGMSNERRFPTEVSSHRSDFHHVGRQQFAPKPEAWSSCASSFGMPYKRSLSPTSVTSDGRTTMSPTDEWQLDDFSGCSGAIARRNERERNRVRTINQTFARLRQHLPASVTWAAAAAAAAAVASATDGPSTSACRKGSGTGVQQHRSGGRPSAASVVPGIKSKKLSKVQILRAAIEYIAHLQRTLATTSDEDATAAASAGKRGGGDDGSDSDRPQQNGAVTEQRGQQNGAVVHGAVVNGNASRNRARAFVALEDAFDAGSATPAGQACSVKTAPGWSGLIYVN